MEEEIGYSDNQITYTALPLKYILLEFTIYIDGEPIEPIEPIEIKESNWQLEGF